MVEKKRKKKKSFSAGRERCLGGKRLLFYANRIFQQGEQKNLLTAAFSLLLRIDENYVVLNYIFEDWAQCSSYPVISG